MFAEGFSIDIVSDSPKLRDDFDEWRMRLSGNAENMKPSADFHESHNGYSFADREAYREAVEKMLD